MQFKSVCIRVVFHYIYWGEKLIWWKLCAECLMPLWCSMLEKNTHYFTHLTMNDLPYCFEHYNHECNRCSFILFIWNPNHWWRWGVNLPPGWTPEDEKLPGSGPPPAPHPEDGLNSCQKLRDYHGNQGARTQNNHMTWEPLPFWGRRWKWCQKYTSKVKI